MQFPLKKLLILLPGTIWGISFIVVELILPYVPPITLTMLRALISSIMLLILSQFFGVYLPKTLKKWWPFLVLAATNQAIPFALSAWGQLQITGGLASILLGVMPLMTILIAAWWTTDEKLTTPKVIGIILGFIGLVILIGPSALAGGNNFIAMLAVLFSSFLYAIGAVYARFVYPQQPEEFKGFALLLRMTTAQFICGVLLLAPFSLWLEQPWALTIPAITWGHLIFLGVGVTAFASMTYFYLIETLGAGIASTTVYLIPISGVIAGALMIGEIVTRSMVVALVFIFFGVFVSSMKPREKVLEGG